MRRCTRTFCRGRDRRACLPASPSKAPRSARISTTTPRLYGKPLENRAIVTTRRASAEGRRHADRTAGTGHSAKRAHAIRPALFLPHTLVVSLSNHEHVRSSFGADNAVARHSLMFSIEHLPSADVCDGNCDGGVSLCASSNWGRLGPRAPLRPRVGERADRHGPRGHGRPVAARE